jgi:hypothetical protein
MKQYLYLPCHGDVKLGPLSGGMKVGSGHTNLRPSAHEAQCDAQFHKYTVPQYS